MAEATLGNIPLHLYFERHMQVNADRLYSFWLEAMAHMRNKPYKVFNEIGYKQMSYVLPKATPGERLLAFALPEGYPGSVGEYAGVHLSLECAYVLLHSVAVKAHVSDESNFYVQTHSGLEVGVKDGLPIEGNAQWDLPVHGVVQEMLRMPRGEPVTRCDYDLIAKLRSALHDVHDKLPEFEGADEALQALRILGNGKHLYEIQSQINQLKSDRQLSDHKIRVIRECIELSEVFTISDRARITAIRSLLCPDFLNLSEFSRRLYHSPEAVPATITERALIKLKDGLAVLLREEETKR